ncbi:hypothetical protein THAOC_12486 [Thalassiosira oceanica]|uniref:peptidylprolyl isomerase n=1 Tax=Thalassiosira oceanica TaxID=159749 RepID=K0T7Z4_THAOC|nr:hypothetical protein THAOC_12486 [Thalassiosira oceanica]|eukprot:EJK66587.1 hypothetical protein THAOC_12486 [Thalassiosira oceanica]
MHRRRSSSSCLVCILLLRWLVSAIAFATTDQFARVNSIGSGESSGAKQSDDTTSSRREMLQKMIFAWSGLATPSQAVMTDETDAFATPAIEGTYYTQRTPSSAAITAPAQTSIMAPNLSDEITFTITKGELQNMQGGIGLELGEVSFRTNFRVIIKSVAPNSLAQKLGIQPNWVVVSIGGANGERTNAAGAAIYFSQAVKKVLSSPDDSTTLSITFRDPAKFRDELESFPSKDTSSGELPTVSTKVAPAGDTTQRFEDGSLRRGATVREQGDQVVTVTQLVPPQMCNRRATTDDLVEISYLGQIVETGEIFDGSAVKINGNGIPGRGNDISVYFVLGKQPFGQFPPGWDVGLNGMCVGERRRLIIPPVLGFGAEGNPRRRIPPNATLQYDVTLVSLNGLATPQ